MPRAEQGVHGPRQYGRGYLSRCSGVCPQVVWEVTCAQTGCLSSTTTARRDAG
jgi:hypothetical protein